MTFGENRREKKPRSLMARGLDALARREYSRDELYRKLTHSLSEDETSDDVANVIADLEKKGYLSNERYAAGRVRTRADAWPPNCGSRAWKRKRLRKPWRTLSPKSTGRAPYGTESSVRLRWIIMKNVSRCVFWPPAVFPLILSTGCSPKQAIALRI